MILMVFIMLALLSYRPPQSNKMLFNPQLKLWLGLSLFLLANATFAQFTIHYGHTRLVGQIYSLNADLNYGLSEVAIEAPHHGVPLVFVFTVIVERERRIVWNETIITLTQRYKLQYNLLHRQYLVQYINTDNKETFLTLTAALTSLGKLIDFPLLNKHLLRNGTYWVNFRIHLDIESLPVPLRPIAYLSSEWRLKSDWYLCPLPLVK